MQRGFLDGGRPPRRPAAPPAPIAEPGTAWSFGNNSCGQCGVDSIEDAVKEPQRVQSLAKWAAAALGDSHGVGASSDGTVYTWGLNDRGQCACKTRGDGDDVLRLPTRVASLDSSPPATSVSCGFEHTACVVDGGGLLTWGSNEYGQLGTSVPPCGQASTSEDKAIADELSVWKPRPVRSLRSVSVVSVVCGHFHTLCLTFQGSVYAWGSNSCGQLGLGDCEDRGSPQLVQSLWATPIIALAAGECHTLALTTHRMVLSWGRAKHGQLGLLLQESSKKQSSARFCSVSPSFKRQKASPHAHVNQSLLSSLLEMGIQQAQAIAALEATHNQGVELAIEWIFAQPEGAQAPAPQGQERHRELVEDADMGEGPPPVQESDVLMPRRVHGITGAASVSAGANHSIVCTESHKVFAFGLNRNGQLGLDCRSNVPIAQTVAALDGKDVVMASCGMSHTLFLCREGAMYGCGSAEDGQLGTKVLGSCVTTPVRVDIPGAEGLVQGEADVVSGGHTSLYLRKVHDMLAFSHEGIKLDLLKAIGHCLQDAKLIAQGGKGNLREHRTSTTPKTLVGMIESIFACPELINIVFGRPHGRPFGVDAEELERIYKLILQCGMRDAEVISAFQNATNSLIRDMQNNANLLTSPESIQVLLAVFQNPLLSQAKVAATMLPKLCKLVIDCIAFSRPLLISWWSEYPASILGGRIVRPFQDYLTTTLSRTQGQITPNIIGVFQVLSLIEDSNSIRNALPMEEFYNELISSKMVITQHGCHDILHTFPGMHYMAWRQNACRPMNGNQVFTYCNYPFLLNNQAKSTLLFVEAHLQMREMVTRSRIEHMFGNVFTQGGHSRGAVAPSRKGEGRRLPSEQMQMPPPEESGIPPHHPDACIIRVRREHLISDALEEIARQNEHDLHKPLKVNFIGEEGVDAGGVKKEFFQLLCEIVMQPEYGMFIFQPESRTYWFNGNSLETEADFMLIGLIMGLAIYNSVILDVQFPPCLYKKLLGISVGLKDLEQMQPELGRSLRKLLEWNGPGSVEDVFCATFAVEQGAFGETKSFDLKPNGSACAVTEENRREYVDLYGDFILNESCKLQFNAFKRGFMLLCEGPVLRLLRPHELEVLVVGTPHLDFKALQANAKYEGGYGPQSQAVVWLWTVIGEMSLEDKKLFLKFVTGSDRAPIGGLGKLTILVQRAGPDSNRLPTSHTCFDTLLLPEYTSRGKLRALLSTAIQNSVGFGLE